MRKADIPRFVDLVATTQGASRDRYYEEVRRA